MKFATIRIEGSLFSPDFLDKLAGGEGFAGQGSTDFGFSNQSKVKDEIARAWADAQGYWRVFKQRRERLEGEAADRPENRNGLSGTTETRNLWLVPLLELLGYSPELNRNAQTLNDRTYPISHCDGKRFGFPIHLLGFGVSLDAKREGQMRMSPHAMVQEYLNLTDHLYAIISNGLQLRLLRDANRLVKLTFLEFDLERMFEEEQFSDFAILYRLLHATRMPERFEKGPESLLEQYHQDSLEDGSRIRDQLSSAVKESLGVMAEGFLNHPRNGDLCAAVSAGHLTPYALQQALLRLVYRTLFLLVIEERDLIFPRSASKESRNLYADYYGLSRLRRLSEKRQLREKKNHDLWDSLKQTFRIFGEPKAAAALGLKALGGLFTPELLGLLERSYLDNDSLLFFISRLDRFAQGDGYRNSKRKYGPSGITRVNYAALNVEEFGSVYEGLLEYDAKVSNIDGHWQFTLQKGDERASTGSHYTPEELVQPLLKHSLEHLLRGARKNPEPEKALLALRICDPACGSGHILLSAARRIGLELARLRTREDQPAPEPYRQALREVIQCCIFGVDKNPLAVELCQIALWLESHLPGAPMGFLDHHIRPGDSIVGLCRKEELQKSVPTEAFKAQPGDDKEVAASLARRNKQEQQGIGSLDFTQAVSAPIHDLAQAYTFEVEAFAQNDPTDVSRKVEAYRAFREGHMFQHYLDTANSLVAPFFVQKTHLTENAIVTHQGYQQLLGGTPFPEKTLQLGRNVSIKMKFFHWFLEFPEVMDVGGFDLIIGNPPFLGNRKIRSTLGPEYLHYLSYAFSPAGAIDLVGYFFRRAYSLLRPNGFFALLATNTIAQGGTREGGLDVICSESECGEIVFAIRSTKWPGLAAVDVALVVVHKGLWREDRYLSTHKVKHITPYLDDQKSMGNPFPLVKNSGKGFVGSYVLGDGFILDQSEAMILLNQNPRNNEVVFPFLIGDDLNSHPEQQPSRYVINFYNWSEEKAKEFPECYAILEKNVKPERQRKKSNGDFQLRPPLPQRWWQYADKRPALYRSIAGKTRVLVINRHTKNLAFSFSPTGLVASDATVVIALDSFGYFSVLSSSLHECWAWKNGSTMGAGTLRYGPSSCFETFPFPNEIERASLVRIGELYYEFRRQVMSFMGLGLTKTYNLFHNKILSPSAVLAESFQLRGTQSKRNLSPTPESEKAANDLMRLRKLHSEMDLAVLDAYGWKDLDLRHDFYEIDYLPEADRIRFTIHPDSRKEILSRLLALNHRIHSEEMAAGVADETGKAIKFKGQDEEEIPFALENPSAEPSQPKQLKSSGITPTDRHVVLWAKIIEIHQNTPYEATLGSVKAEKISHMVEALTGVDVGREPRRLAAGPVDYQHYRKVLFRAEKIKAFKEAPRQGGRGHFFEPLLGFRKQVFLFDSVFLEHQDIIGRVFEWMLPKRTDEAELVATLYAAWNDLKAKNEPDGEAELIDAFYQWGSSKEKFSPAQIRGAIRELRERGFAPTGGAKLSGTKGQT